MVSVGGRDLVVIVAQLLEGAVEGVFALLTLVLLVKGLCGVVVVELVVAMGQVVGVVYTLEGGVVVELGVDVLCHFGGGHLKHFDQHHLLLGETLLLDEALLLFLY